MFRIPQEVVDLALKHKITVQLDHDTGVYQIWNLKYMIGCSRDTTEGAIAVLKDFNRRIEEKEAVSV